MAGEKHVHWFDLGRFGASLKVVPLSPLRGVALTCLVIEDAAGFGRHVLGREDAPEERPIGQRSWTKDAWWEQARALGFSERTETFDLPGDATRLGHRLYSERTSFTFAELKRLVPGLEQDDYRLMSLDAIVHRPVPAAEMTARWKNFSEQVLRHEAVGVWTPLANPFEKAYAEAQQITALREDRAKAVGMSPLLDDPTTRWFANELDKARYRENALVPFYVDPEAAAADGLALEDLRQVDLPYALPLWVERDGRVIALKDVRHIPELHRLNPSSYVGSVEHAGTGMVVGLLRHAREVEDVYRAEVAQWREWAEAEGPVDLGALKDSVRRAVVAEAELQRRFPAARFGLQGLLEADQKADAPLVIKDLEVWSDDDVRAMWQSARRFVRDGGADDSQRSLNGLLARARQQVADQAREVALQALREVAEKVQSEGGEVEGHVRHEDAGEKIGGARKDFHRRAMAVEDLELMNDYERRSLVVKKNVWPPLDYQAMKDEGVSAQAAVAIKYLKDMIAVEPERGGRWRPEVEGVGREEEYIRAVGLVRDEMSRVKTLDEFARSCLKLFEVARERTTYVYGGTPMQLHLGEKACHLLWDAERTYGSGDNMRTEAVVPAKVRQEIAKRVREGREWEYLIKPTREKSDQEREADAEKSDRERELHRPHLEHVQRIGGQSWRGGRDVDADDLISHFGFRAVEFGNWLPQDERQAVLNMAFDSMCDLADALALPPQAVSFHGRLAVAFGSRGRGGKNAALAHFEPGRTVMNFTRLRGAGTVAHEWFHALDWHLGDGVRYLSEKARPRYDGDPMPKLVRAMRYRLASDEDLLSKAKGEANKCREYAGNWCYLQPREARVEIGAALVTHFEKARVKLYESALRGLAPSSKTGRPVGLTTDGATDLSDQFELRDEAMAAIKALCPVKREFTKVRDKIEGNIVWMLRHMGRWVTIEAARDTGVLLDERMLGGDNSRETRYFEQAKALDAKRSSAYWSTEIEMFARAGAQYVLYELARKGVRSDYLVFGSEEDRYAEHPIGNPNPGSEDRLLLQAHFSALLEDYRLRAVRASTLDAALEP